MRRTIAQHRASRTAALVAATAKQAALTWAIAALTRADVTPGTVARDLTILTSLGVPQADAERTIHKALAAAAAAYRIQMAVHASDAASDSENTDTGRMASVSR